MVASFRDRIAFSRLFQRAHDAVVPARRNRNRFLGSFESFAAAEAAAPRKARLGYDNAELASWYRERLGRIQSEDYPVLFWLQRALADTRGIFDFGGHVGLHFFAFDPLLTWPAGSTWTVCDVPAVVEAGRRVASERGAPRELRFTTRPEDADGADLFLASGSLQYLPIGFLHDLLRRLSRPPKRLLINKLPLHPTVAYTTLQDTRASFHPYAVDSRPRWLSELGVLGYRALGEWSNFEHDCRVSLRSELNVPEYSGFYLERSGG
jgi:putative methyltransferase (TIGR04325 family)